MGIHVFLIGGELKSSTEAVVGSQAIKMLSMYHFTKGFFGTNGITKREGFTTPDTNEALVKEKGSQTVQGCVCSCRLLQVWTGQLGDIRRICTYAYSDREDSGRVSGMWKCFESGIKE